KFSHDLVSMKTELQVAGGPLLCGSLLAQPFVGTAVPERNSARAVVAAGDGTLEASVIERMVFHVDGQALDGGVERGAVGQRPRLEHAVHFEPQVIVETSCAMSLNEKPVAFL